VTRREVPAGDLGGAAPEEDALVRQRRFHPEWIVPMVSVMFARRSASGSPHRRVAEVWIDLHGRRLRLPSHDSVQACAHAAMKNLGGVQDLFNFGRLLALLHPVGDGVSTL
jgi:hypothetical protein